MAEGVLHGGIPDAVAAKVAKADGFSHGKAVEIITEADGADGFKLAAAGRSGNAGNAHGHESARLYIALSKAYTAAGRKLDSPESFDAELYAHLAALYDRNFGFPDSVLDAAIAINVTNLPPFDGSELTYAESCSFVAWLIDQYDLKTVLDAWQKVGFSGTFGKDYGTLKTQWQSFLQEYR